MNVKFNIPPKATPLFKEHRFLMVMHGGRVSVESRLGTGTTVIVTLPRDPRAGGATEGADPAVEVEETSPSAPRR